MKNCIKRINSSVVLLAIIDLAVFAFIAWLIYAIYVSEPDKTAPPNYFPSNYEIAI